MEKAARYYAFGGEKLLAQGSLATVAIALKNKLDQGDMESILLFGEATGRQRDIDLSGSLSDVEQRYGAAVGAAGGSVGEEGDGAPKKSRGRPKLGVVGREVTLLPRHWDWLDRQRGGASAALRRLIDQERKAGSADQEIRQSQDSANRFMLAMAGNLPGFEEAVRALYGRDKSRFEQETSSWPVDIRRCARKYAEPALI